MENILLYIIDINKTELIKRRINELIGLAETEN